MVFPDGLLRAHEEDDEAERQPGHPVGTPTDIAAPGAFRGGGEGGSEARQRIACYGSCKVEPIRYVFVERDWLRLVDMVYRREERRANQDRSQDTLFARDK